jgi:hypothetical protein
MNIILCLLVYFLIVSVRESSKSFDFSFLNRLFVSYPSIVVLNVKSSHVLEANLHTFLLSWGEQLVLECIDAGVETFRVQVDCQLLILHATIIILIEAQIKSSIICTN